MAKKLVAFKTLCQEDQVSIRLSCTSHSEFSKKFLYLIDRPAERWVY